MRERIKEIMKVVFNLSVIPDDVSNKNCPEWDSMHHLSLVIELESSFNIAFEPDEINEMKSLEMIERVIIKKGKLS